MASATTLRRTSDSILFQLLQSGINEDMEVSTLQKGVRAIVRNFSLLQEAQKAFLSSSMFNEDEREGMHLIMHFNAEERDLQSNHAPAQAMALWLWRTNAHCLQQWQADPYSGKKEKYLDVMVRMIGLHYSVYKLWGFPRRFILLIKEYSNEYLSDCLQCCYALEEKSSIEEEDTNRLRHVFLHATSANRFLYAELTGQARSFDNEVLPVTSSEFHQVMRQCEDALSR